MFKFRNLTRKMSLRPLAVFALVFACAVLGFSARHVDQIAAQQNTPSFYAKGTHQCQSKTSIGHTCKVDGYFNDCDEAFRKLKMQDCCPNSKYGGNSTDFTLDSCTPR